jgi:hypothetical protein
MNSFSIFAGVDAAGGVRFVGDVPRGAACGCRCAACGAPLVAKRGDVKTWHFAHEASQERPECFAGAVNLLRRLAIEDLQQRDVLTLPPYRFPVTTAPPLPFLMEFVEWEVGPARWMHSQAQPARHAPVAALQLENTGTIVQLFAEIAAGPNTQLDTVPPSEGRLLFDVPLPAETGQLADMEAAKTHIRLKGAFHWRGLPVRHPKIEETRQRLELHARQSVHMPFEVSALHRMGGQQPPSPPAPRPMPRPPVAAPVEFDESPWATWRKSPHAFLFYGMKDGSAWVLFPHRDSRYAMAPWPSLFDGWDTKVPPRVATLDRGLGVYFVLDRLTVMVELGRFSRVAKTYSSWAELAVVQWPS